MDGLTVNGLVKRYANSLGVDGVSVRVERGQFVTLLGPSGCGKTTTLRCIAGLEFPEKGEIEFDGRVTVAPGRGIFLPPAKRGLGMVFQSYALWPHMSVAANVAYPLRRRKTVTRSRIAVEVAEMLDAVGLEGIGRRYPSQLSGGQQQRVALARALVSRPSLLLLDEPLSNLDARLRLQMRAEIRNIHDRFGMTSVYVTHDQTEAMTLSDKIVVMDGGRVQQVASPRELYTAPANEFVARFVGFENIVQAEVVGRNSDQTVLQLAGSDTRIMCSPVENLSRGEAVQIAIRSSKIQMVPWDGARVPECSVRAVITSTAYLGDSTQYTTEAADSTFVVTTRQESEPADGTASISIGEPVLLTFPSEDVVLLERKDTTHA